MKQLTLEISERQEQEELSEALQQLQRVTLGEEIRQSELRLVLANVLSCQSVSFMWSSKLNSNSDIRMNPDFSIPPHSLTRDDVT